MNFTRFAAGSGCAAFLAWSTAATAAPTISATSPASNAVFSAVTGVQITVTAVTYPVTKVTAELGGNLLNLTLTNGKWQGTYDAAFVKSLPYGAQTMVVTAYDSAPSQTVLNVPLTHDESPTIKKVSGRVGILMPPTFPIRVECNDDGPNGCTSMELSVQHYNGTAVLATGVNVIDTTVDLSPYVDQNVVLRWRGYDSRNQSYTGTRLLRSITTLPKICQISEPELDVTSTGAVDVDGDRILLVNRNVVDRRTKQVTSIPKPASATGGVRQAALVPNGALLAYDNMVDLWRGAPATPFELRAFGDHFVVFGNYYCGGTDLQTAPAGSLAKCSMATSFMGGTGAACGSVIPADPDIQVYSAACDNGNVAYEYSTKSIPGNNHRGLRYRDKNGVTSDIVQERISFQAQVRKWDQSLETVYDVAGDWVAFTLKDGAGVRQWYRRDPAGNIAVATQMDGSSDPPRLVGLAPTGELLLHSAVGGALYWGIFRVPPGTLLGVSTLAIPSFNIEVEARWRDGAWYFLSAGGTYQFNDGAPQPFECPSLPAVQGDAGADASTDASTMSDADAGGTSSSSTSSSGASSTSSSSSGASSSSSTSGGSGDAGGSSSGAAGGAGETSSCSSSDASGSPFAFSLSGVALIFALLRRRR